MSATPRPPGRDLFTSVILFALLSYFGWMLWQVSTVRQPSPVAPALTKLQSRDLAGARAVFTSALSASRDDGMIYRQIGEICLAGGQPAMAVEYLETGLQHVNEKTSVGEKTGLYVTLSAAYSETEPTRPRSKAIATARKALEQSPKDPVALNCLGYVLADNDIELDQAEQYLSRALTAIGDAGEDPSTMQLRGVVLDSYGWLLYRQGKFDRAVDHLVRGINLCESSAGPSEMKVFYYHLASAYRKAGNLVGARNAIDVALFYDPAYADAKAESASIPASPTPKKPDAPGKVTTPTERPTEAPSTTTTIPSIPIHPLASEKPKSR